MRHKQPAMSIESGIEALIQFALSSCARLSSEWRRLTSTTNYYTRSARDSQNHLTGSGNCSASATEKKKKMKRDSLGRERERDSAGADCPAPCSICKSAFRELAANESTELGNLQTSPSSLFTWSGGGKRQILASVRSFVHSSCSSDIVARPSHSIMVSSFSAS